jgi:hypothetical protein
LLLVTRLSSNAYRAAYQSYLSTKYFLGVLARPTPVPPILRQRRRSPSKQIGSGRAGLPGFHWRSCGDLIVPKGSGSIFGLAVLVLRTKSPADLVPVGQGSLIFHRRDSRITSTQFNYPRNSPGCDLER